MTDDPIRREPEKAPDAQKLEQFLRGETTRGESERIIGWARSQPQWDASSLWERIKPEVERDAATPSLRVSTGRRGAFVSRRTRWQPAIAAAAVFAIVGSAVLYTRLSTPPAEPKVAKVYRTERGQRASFQLADGSAIHLGPQSSLRIDPSFGTSNRIVRLEGDGYFHVTHDADKPFVVHTPRGEVRDLGTRFVIRARDDAAPVDVAVSEGVVAIGSSFSGSSGGLGALGPDSVVVHAGELVRIDEKGPGSPVRVRDIDRYFAWTQGKLVFDRMPLTDVLAELNRWFAEDFVLGDPSLGSVRLTTELRGETLSEALLVLETSLDMDVRRANGRVVLRRRAAAADTSARR